MRLRFLGTGTSQGVPVIGCECAVCASVDLKDKRLRSSVLVSDGPVNILIDAGPDLRQQMLREAVHHVDAILLTHEHNDHVIGLDDIRPFNFRTGQPMAVYALQRVAAELRRRFDYVFGDPIPGLPRMELHVIGQDSAFQVKGLNINAVGVMHGPLPILGFRFGNLAYLTDVKSLADSEKEKVKQIDRLIVSALHLKPHPTHMNLEETLALIEELRPGHAWLTHVSHQMGLHEAVQKNLPPNVTLAYDGLEIVWDR